jgi:hypothetical protein
MHNPVPLFCTHPFGHRRVPLSSIPVNVFEHAFGKDGVHYCLEKGWRSSSLDFLCEYPLYPLSLSLQKPCGVFFSLNVITDDWICVSLLIPKGFPTPVDEVVFDQSIEFEFGSMRRHGASIFEHGMPKNSTPHFVNHNPPSTVRARHRCDIRHWRFYPRTLRRRHRYRNRYR